MPPAPYSRLFEIELYVLFLCILADEGDELLNRPVGKLLHSFVHLLGRDAYFVGNHLGIESRIVNVLGNCQEESFHDVGFGIVEERVLGHGDITIY